jgi:hypothetical protein
MRSVNGNQLNSDTALDVPAGQSQSRCGCVRGLNRLFPILFMAVMFVSPSAVLHPALGQTEPLLPPGDGLEIARVWTDQPDYSPGMTATIMGQGFEPGETVTVQVVQADGHESDADHHQPWAVTADQFGGFTTTWQVCQDCLDEDLRVLAEGSIANELVNLLSCLGVPYPYRGIPTSSYYVLSIR